MVRAPPAKVGCITPGVSHPFKVRDSVYYFFRNILLVLLLLNIYFYVFRMRAYLKNTREQ